MNREHRIKHLGSRALQGGLIAATLLLAGCYESHLARRETISVHGGDAVATNIIRQTVDPWPAKAWDKVIAHDGTRMVNAVDAYHNPDAGDPSVADTVTSLIDSGESSQTTD